MTRNTDRSSDGEIDLVDIWLVMAHHKFAFYGALLVCVVLGMAMYFFVPERYEHKLMIEIGGIWTGNGAEMDFDTALGRFELLESPDVVKVKIEESVADQVIAEIRRETSIQGVPSKVQVSIPEGTEIVQMEVTAPLRSEEAISRVLQGISDRILNTHNKLLTRRVEALRKIATDRLSEIDERITLLQASRASVVKNGSVESKGIALLMIDSNIQELMSERNNLEREIEVGLTLNARETRVIAGPAHGQNPIGPGVALALVLSIFGGVLIGVVLVGLLSVREKVALRQRAAASQGV